MLMIGRGRPNTATLVAIAMAVGHLVGMFWKNEHKRARPVQFFPAVMPAIVTPAHPSYPSNHSFQSHLIAHTLTSLFGEPLQDAMRAPLFALAARIGQNREVAGVHFLSDTDAGRELSAPIFKKLQGISSFAEICTARILQGSVR